jgi:ATP-dependent RNA helicase RhlE
MTQTTFADLQLQDSILRSVTEQGYTVPTPIQAAAIPHLLQGRDLLGIAQTGTGKTAAFALPILDAMARKPWRPTPRKPSVLVLTPTRELASQIGESFRVYGRHISARHTVIFGGVGQAPQVRAMQRGVHVLVATPGRLMDLIQQRHVDLGEVKVFVLDEADRMLDMGFIRDVRKMIAMLPRERQSLLFSATMPPDIVALTHSILRQPKRVEVTPPATTVDRVAQSVMMVEKSDKRDLLAVVLGDTSITKALVFTRTKHGADRVVKHLRKIGESVDAIHGNKTQNARERALEGFKSGKVRVLVATDIAARGIDVRDITHVINFDLPNVSDSYVHRIGRTARAGRDGAAISFCDIDERAYLRDIEKLIRTRVPVVSEHPFRSRATSTSPARKQPAKRVSSGGPARGRRNANGNARGKAFGKRNSRGRGRTYSRSA